MTRVLAVRFSTLAADEIESADRWWKRNRPAARSAITEELACALEVIVRQPSAGALARNVRLAGVRRVRLARVSYHLYYRVTPEAVEVLAFWHARRGTPPPI